MCILYEWFPFALVQGKSITFHKNVTSFISFSFKTKIYFDYDIWVFLQLLRLDYIMLNNTTNANSFVLYPIFLQQFLVLITLFYKLINESTRFRRTSY